MSVLYGLVRNDAAGEMYDVSPTSNHSCGYYNTHNMPWGPIREDIVIHNSQIFHWG